MQIARLPDGVLKALREAWGEVAKEEGARDYFFKQVLEDIAKFEAAEAAPQAPAVSDCEAGKHAALFNYAVKNPVTVVEYRIKGIFGRPS